MNTLGIYSFGTLLSVSFSDGEKFIENSRMVGLKHNQILLPQIDAVLNDASVKPDEIGLVVCSSGPGSFTALRILLSTAKGFAAGAGAAFIAVPTFDVAGRAFSFFPGIVVPVIDAKRGRFYVSFYSEGSPLKNAAELSKDQIVKQLQCYDEILFAGEDALLFGDLADGARIRLGETIPSTGKHLLQIGREMYREGVRSSEDEAPLYIRLSDAELNKKKNNE